ncbi:MAG: hypothetical protein ABFD08_16685 [Syntrophomonas sp.]
MPKKRLIIIISVIAAVLLIGTGTYVYSIINSIPQIFKLNEKRKAEGYYLAEFEFKMLGCAYYLDKGQYITALSRLKHIHDQLESGEGLIKVPKFNNQKEELAFYLKLQNPKTGAFMDDAYPVFTYIGPTANVIYHIEYLCQATGQPLHLKYPLRYLDEINTPAKLAAFLDDLSTVGWAGAKFRSPYIEAAELNCYPEDMKRTGLYSFSPEWKKALLQWFYNNQDSKTGYWGPRLRSSGELLNSGDLLSTEKILKLFVDNQGNNLYAEFPLRHRDKLFASTLRRISEPMPEDLDEQHEWSLVVNRGTRLLTRYLWNGASAGDKEQARKVMEDVVRTKYADFYVKSQGAFSLYSGAKRADLDGTGEILSYLNEETGAFSNTRQRFLWGDLEKITTDLGSRETVELYKKDLALLKKSPGVNSLRLYKAEPALGDYASGVVLVCYPNDTQVLDALDLLPRLKQWVDSAPQIMGNWVTRESIIQELATLNIQSVPVATGNPSLKLANELLQKNGKLVVIGFDVLQIPRYKITFVLKI